MRRRKINLRLPQLKKQNLLFKLSIIIVFLLIAFFGLKHLERALKNLDCFKIEKIIVTQGNPEEFAYLKGQNIFTIDLKREAGYIQEAYPNYKQIRLIRLLPNRLSVDFIKRKPVAFIKLYRYFYVDKDQVVFNAPVEETLVELPVILGLETKIFGPKSGRKYNIRELALAINIIQELNNNGILRGYKIKTVDVNNAFSASFILPNGLEVKTGQDEIKARIKLLSILLTNIKNDLNYIKYIDLRFKEPVVKFKEKNVQ